MIGCLDEMEKAEGTYCLYIVEYNGTQLRYLYGIYAGQMHNLSLFRQMERGEGGEFLRRSQEPRFLTDNPMFFVQQADEYGGCRFQINSRQRILCEAELASLETIQKMGYRKWILQALGKPACAQEENSAGAGTHKKSKAGRSGAGAISSIPLWQVFPQNYQCFHGKPADGAVRTALFCREQKRARPNKPPL